MTLPDSFGLRVGTQIRFSVSGSLSPADDGTNLTIGTPTDVTLTLSALADGAGRQSDKFNFGETRAAAYECLGAFDFTGESPTSGEVIEVYFLPSTHATQANGNVAGNSGADAAAPGGALGSITLAEFKRQGVFVGNFVCHDGGVVQNGFIGTLVPTSQYGQLLVINESGDALEADNVESHVVLNPIVDYVVD